MKPAIALKQKLNNNELTLGVLCTEHIWTDFVRVAVEAKLDYIIIDMEHGPHSMEMAADLCTLGRACDFAVLIRTISADADVVRKAADLGPCGIMIPTVESTDQLDTARNALWLPPRGRRRPGGRGNMWPSNFNASTWRSDVEDHFIVIPQIESQRGIDNADSIARHELTTAMALGPYDLSADLGCCWEPDSPKLVAGIDAVRAAGDRAEKRTWMLGDGPALQAQGFTFICIGEPVNMMKQAASQTVAKMKGESIATNTAAEHG